MKHITTTQFAKVIHQHPMKVKRHARELFGYDEIAGRQKGYARKISVADDCLPLALFTHLVSDRQCSIPDAKAIIKDIKPILNDLKILPLTYERWFSFMFHGPVINWDIQIYFTKSESHILEVIGELEASDIDEKIEGYSGFSVTQKKILNQTWYKRKMYDWKESVADDFRGRQGVAIELNLYTDFFVPNLKKAGYL